MHHVARTTLYSVRFPGFPLARYAIYTIGRHETTGGVSTEISDLCATNVSIRHACGTAWRANLRAKEILFMRIRRWRVAILHTVRKTVCFFSQLSSPLTSLSSSPVQRPDRVDGDKGPSRRPGHVVPRCLLINFETVGWRFCRARAFSNGRRW